MTQTLGGGRALTAVDPHLHEDDLATHRILLCTDGLTNFVPRSQIADALRREDSEESIKMLVALALAAGAPDNVTVLTVDVALDQQKDEAA